MPRDLLSGLFEAIDAKDTERFSQFLTEDAAFRFGSAPTLEGRVEIGAGVDEFFAQVAGLRHVIGKVFEDGDSVACEGQVTYTRHDGSEITLPFVNVFELKDGLIADYKIYSDLGPLFSDTRE